MTEHSQDLLIFGIVLALRLLVPLAIPRFPLPAIVVAMIIDAADQTIFQNYTSLNLDWYQGYDKALDIYYLAIAYIATMRNWTNLHAFGVGRFLWYYRLVGVVLFEMTSDTCAAFHLSEHLRILLRFHRRCANALESAPAQQAAYHLCRRVHLDLYQAPAGVLDPYRSIGRDGLHS